MATLYITEFDLLGRDAHGETVMGGVQPPLVDPYSMAITGSSTQSQIFSNQTRYVELHCDAVCSVKIGTNPTAVATSGRLGLGERIYYPLRAGISGGLRVAVISNT